MLGKAGGGGGQGAGARARRWRPAARGSYALTTLRVAKTEVCGRTLSPPSRSAECAQTAGGGTRGGLHPRIPPVRGRRLVCRPPPNRHPPINPVLEVLVRVCRTTGVLPSPGTPAAALLPLGVPAALSSVESRSWPRWDFFLVLTPAAPLSPTACRTIRGRLSSVRGTVAVAVASLPP